MAIEYSSVKVHLPPNTTVVPTNVKWLGSPKIPRWQDWISPRSAHPSCLRTARPKLIAPCRTQSVRRTDELICSLDKWPEHEKVCHSLGKHLHQSLSRLAWSPPKSGLARICSFHVGPFYSSILNSNNYSNRTRQRQDSTIPPWSVQKVRKGQRSFTVIVLKALAPCFLSIGHFADAAWHEAVGSCATPEDALTFVSKFKMLHLPVSDRVTYLVPKKTSQSQKASIFRWLNHFEITWQNQEIVTEITCRSWEISFKLRFV